jgi:hypothetical protein
MDGMTINHIVSIDHGSYKHRSINHDGIMGTQWGCNEDILGIYIEVFSYIIAPPRNDRTI